MQDMGYDSDETMCQEDEYDVVVDSAVSETEEDMTSHTYKNMFELNISEICSESETEEEREEKRQKRIEELANNIAGE